MNTAELHLELIIPYTTFVGGKPKPIPYVLSGVLTQGGFSVLGAKPKHGKSSMSRALTVAVTKGEPFLGRATEQGEVILISLEDQRAVVDNSLKLMEWDAKKDGRISIVDE